MLKLVFIYLLATGGYTEEVYHLPKDTSVEECLDLETHIRTTSKENIYSSYCVQDGIKDESE